MLLDCPCPGLIKTQVAGCAISIIYNVHKGLSVFHKEQIFNFWAPQSLWALWWAVWWDSTLAPLIFLDSHLWSYPAPCPSTGQLAAAWGGYFALCPGKALVLWPSFPVHSGRFHSKQEFSYLFYIFELNFARPALDPWQSKQIACTWIVTMKSLPYQHIITTGIT